MEDEEPDTEDPTSTVSGLSSGAFLRALAEAPPVGQLDRTGERMAHFLLEERLGRGGMGEVYVALDEKLHRKVAIKVLRPEVMSDLERRKRFLREARAAAAVTHRHIVTIHEVGEWEDDVFLAMELVDGETLRARLSAKAPLPLADATTLLKMMARGLRKAHRAGIIHRDLKPDNVMLTEDDDVKLLDFGLAKLKSPKDHMASVEALTTEEGRVMGTPGYMSPEQGTGKPVDLRTDVFSLGVIAYEMVTGRRPFTGDSSMDIIISTSRDEPPPPSEVRAEASPLEAIILRCLAKDPEERFDDLDGFLAALEGVEAAPASRPLATEARDAPASVVEEPKRSWLLPVVVLGAGAAAAVAFMSSSSPPASAPAPPTTVTTTAPSPPADTTPTATPAAATATATDPPPPTTAAPPRATPPRPLVPRPRPTSTPRPKSTGVNLGI